MINILKCDKNDDTNITKYKISDSKLLGTFELTYCDHYRNELLVNNIYIEDDDRFYIFFDTLIKFLNNEYSKVKNYIISSNISFCNICFDDYNNTEMIAIIRKLILWNFLYFIICTKLAFKRTLFI